MAAGKEKEPAARPPAAAQAAGKKASYFTKVAVAFFVLLALSLWVVSGRDVGRQTADSVIGGEQVVEGHDDAMEAGGVAVEEKSQLRPIGEIYKTLSSNGFPRPVTVIDEVPERMVVIGDLHGDLRALRRTLSIAGLVEEKEDVPASWTGGSTVFVQVGDIFDRGEEDLEVEEYLQMLKVSAEEMGGKVYRVFGNHEISQFQGDHSMAHHSSFPAFADLTPLLEGWLEENESVLSTVPEWARARIVALFPGAPLAQILSGHSLILKVGRNLFTHGGLRPQHVREDVCEGAAPLACAEILNGMQHNWLVGAAGADHLPLIWKSDSLLWNRSYSQPDCRPIQKKAALEELEEVLRLTGTDRLFVGHTPQRCGINLAAGQSLIRVDTGMSKYVMSGQKEAIEVLADGSMSILTANGRVSVDERDVDRIHREEEF